MTETFYRHQPEELVLGFVADVRPSTVCLRRCGNRLRFAKPKD